MLAFCIGISTCSGREDLDQPVAPEVSTPTEDQPPTEKNQDSHNPALCKLCYLCMYICTTSARVIMKSRATQPTSTEQ